MILAGISFLPTVSNAQLREKAEELLSTTLGNDPEEPVTPTDTLSLDEQHRKDSIKMQELALQLQEMKLNEILLKDELESTKNSNATADSLKRSEQRNRIDSLRALTPGVPVVMEKTKNIAPHVMACKRCEGKGRIFYLDQGGAPLSAKCPVCNGSGRVKVQSKVITRIEPFVPGEDDTELMTM